jgi:hypothetical protein
MEEHLADEGPKCCKIVHVEGVSQCITDKTNLFKEKIMPNSLCRICGKVEETIEHVPLNCPTTRDAWSVCCRKLQKCGEMYDEFILFVDIMHKKLDKDESEAMVMIAQNLWLRKKGFARGSPHSILLAFS